MSENLMLIETEICDETSRYLESKVRLLQSVFMPYWLSDIMHDRGYIVQAEWSEDSDSNETTEFNMLNLNKLKEIKQLIEDLLLPGTNTSRMEELTKPQVNNCKAIISLLNKKMNKEYRNNPNIIFTIS